MSLTADTGLEVNVPIDDVLGSRQLFISASARPSVRFGKCPILFGGYLPLIGPLALRPDIRGFFEARDVLDAGTDAALLKQNVYYGVGFDASLKMRFPFVPMLSKFSAEVGYKQMRLFEQNVNFDNVIMREASLTYEPVESANYVIKGTYANGRDLVTFQEQKTFSAQLGIKY
jgi:hypothetical protein